MASADNRFRYEDGSFMMPKVSAATIEAGDLLFHDTGSDGVNDAGAFTWSTDTATTQAGFCRVFAGVSGSRSLTAETDDIIVRDSGVFEFDCAAATFSVGDLVGPAKASGNALEPKKVVAVVSENLAIGRVAKDYGSNTTKVLVHVKGNRMGASLAPAMTARVATAAAAGSAQGDATALSPGLSYSVSAADGTKGVVLPDAKPGLMVNVYNEHATNGLKIYPNTSDTINGGSANAAITMEGKTLAQLICLDTTNWAAAFTVNT